MLYIFLRLSFILILASSISGLAQNIENHFCATDQLLNKRLSSDNDFTNRHKVIEKAIYQRVSSIHLSKIEGDQYVVPVVVHIIHNNGAENISDAQIMAGIQHLNNAFSNSGAYAQDGGIDIGIQFCLAIQDPSGNETNGITRTQSAYTNLILETQDIQMKNLTRWDPTKYLNIWLVNEITSMSSGSGVAGYAYFPSSHGRSEDGIVNEARWFGSSIENSKIHIHEAGHYFGCYHTFQGGCTNNDCLVDGDRVCDTPPDNSTAPVSCGGSINTCHSDSDDISLNNPFRPTGTGGLGDQNDMFINYMDYGYQVCQELFTSGQKDRMISSLTVIRSSLLSSPGCTSPCTNPIVASFTSSALVCDVGTTLTFTNTSSGGTSYTWQIDDVNFASTPDASYTFSSTGAHVVKLIVSNSQLSCIQQISVTIQVNCQVNAAFTVPETNVATGTALNFTNTSVNATSYKWYVDGVLVSTAANLSRTFINAGGYMVYLIASNASCSDTSSYTFIQVSNCSASSRRGNVWYFARNAGLDFNTPTPTALTNGAVNTYEGCASISDNNGKIIFYTDGIRVYNRNHTAMPNGTGLLAHSSATQAAIIIPKPGSSTLYYIFTVDELAGVNGLRYSEVDMTLDGGLGNINANKNILLHTPVTEKLTAVRKANGKDFWVLAHQWNNNAFMSYSVTSAGVNTTPVITNAGTVHSGGQFPNYNSVGYLRVSPDAKRLALANRDMFLFELFDFNNATGIMSNPIALTSASYSVAYGVEFSSDNSKLYCMAGRTIYQYDLLAGPAAAIRASVVTIASTSSNYGGGLQLAPNGKIYFARQSSGYLGVINVPNAKGIACNYVDNGIYLAGRNSEAGLPNYTPSFFNTVKILGPDTVCAYSKGIPYYTSGEKGAVFSWSIKGRATINNAADSSVIIDFNGPGTDTLVVNKSTGCGNATDTLFIKVSNGPTAAFTSSATAIPAGGSVTFTNTTTGGISYKWFKDGSLIGTSTDLTYPFPNEGGYLVYLVAFNGFCYDTSATTFIQVGSCIDKRTNIWYFGDRAGLNFTGNTPAAITNSAMNAGEGCASISDAQGNLLFYTDGNIVYNKNHVTMANGTGLAGAPSSTQAAMIIPKPGNCNIYYLFTVDQLAGPNGLKYSTIDLSLNSGLGAVTIKNVSLSTPVSEKITACLHNNGKDIWVVAHAYNSNSFLSYLISATGVNPTPVVSTSGTIHTGGTLGTYNSIGQMKVSPNGKRIACAISEAGIFEVFDFNNTTGTVSNPITLSGHAHVYGVEFSPDNSKLYGTEIYALKLYQYNLSSGSIPSIIASKTLIANSASDRIGALQLGPNGKIYVSTLYLSAVPANSFIGEIRLPNATGASSNYVEKSISLGGKYAALGLPNFIQSYFAKQIAVKGPDSLCAFSNNIQYQLIKNKCISGASSFSMKGRGIISAVTDTSVTINFKGSGVDTLIYRHPGSCGLQYDTLFVKVNPNPSINLGNDTSFCSNSSLVLNPGPGFSSYKWQNNSTASTYTVSSTGKYWVTVVSQGGCAVTDTININLHAMSINLNLINDTTICQGNVVPMNAGSGFKEYLWQDGSTDSTYTAYLSGKYWITVKDFCNNTNSDTVNIFYQNLRLVDLGPDTSICDGPFTLMATAGLKSYLWQDSSTTSTFNVDSSGTYYVIVTNAQGCTSSDTISVSQFDSPVITLGPDTILCSSETINLSAGTGYSSYEWQDNSQNPSFEAFAEGTYWVRVTDSHTCHGSDTINIVLINSAAFINLGNDSTICEGNIVDLHAGSGYIDYLWQDGSHDSIYSAMPEGKYWVRVKNICNNTAADTIKIIYDHPQLVDLGKDTALCFGPVILQADADMAEYKWQDNSTGSFFNASSSGKYYVKVTNLQGCVSSDTVMVNILTGSTPALGSDTTACSGDTILINAFIPKASYLWNDHTNLSYYKAFEPGIVQVTVTDSNGCYSTASRRIDFKDCCNEVTIPNLITPNTDGANDLFTITCIQNSIWNLEVYNQWGQVVYKNSNYKNTWGGEDLSDGVYYFILKKNDHSASYKGWVHIIR